ncbi:MAG: inorganic pyrophosphatase [Oscillospiraceae bacterium]|nr:inorganic pyrophosphatase [Oscillospiraceae bacterium]
MHSHDFWQALDHLAATCELVIDRPKGSRHPKWTDYVYPLDYGYLRGTSSPDGGGIDVWKGSAGERIDAVICTVDLLKKDSEIKILMGCTEEEKRLALPHNENQQGILVRRT